MLLTYWKGEGYLYDDDAVKLLEDSNISVKRNPMERWYTEEELIRELADADAIIAGGDPLTHRVFESTSSLKVVARVGAGYDNVDVKAATDKDIFVTNTPIPDLSRGIADATFCLILGILRRLPEMDRSVRRGEWKPGFFIPIIHDVNGKTLGIVGLGRIGGEVAKRAKGFDMKILYHDIVRRHDLEQELGVEYSDFDTLLSQADIVTLHVPLTAETEGLISERELNLMKKNAYMVNISRGGVVDIEALYTALKDGRIAGAGIDVFPKEPPPPEHPLLKLENVVFTPHVGAGYETYRLMSFTAAEQVMRVLNGRKPKYLLNPELLLRIPLSD